MTTSTTPAVPLRLPELERNIVATLGLAIIAGREDERFAELGGNAAMLLDQLLRAGGLAELVEIARLV